MKDEKKILRKQYIKQFYYKNKFVFILSIVTSLLGGLLNLLITWLMQQLIDTMSGEVSTLPLHVLALLTIVFILLVLFVQMIDYFSTPRFMKKAMWQYKNYAFQKLMQKSIASFNDEATATYISALSNDTNSLESNYLENQFKLITNAVMFFGSFAMMIAYSPLLTLAAIVLSIFPFMASMLTGNRLENIERKISDRNESFMAALKDSLSGFSVIKSFKAEQSIYEIFKKSNQESEEVKQKRREITTILGMIGSATGIIAQFGVFLVGAYLAMSGRSITAGVVMVFVNLMNFVIQPIAQMPSILANRKASNALIDKLANALNTNVRDDGVQISSNLQSGIEIKDLCFGYQEDNEILHHMNTTFEAGKSYAIVGGSGSGKSTLLQLLMASYNGYTGSIQFDGTELKKISSESLYDLVSIVQQSVFVFNASIRDNITMFDKFSKEDVDHAIQMSGLSTLIQNRGEDYLCGENGCGLSGGEKQRISIARSLLRKSSVLLVDEATAALDAQTAYQVSNSILHLDGMTRIVITHSLEEALLRQYDNIVTIKSGQIVESGNFDELMERKGYFYSLFTVSQ